MAEPLSADQQELVRQAVQSQALKDMLTVGGIGLAGGVATRGLLGLLSRPVPSMVNRGPGPSVVTIPTPVYTSAADQKRAIKTAYAREDWPLYYPGLVTAGLGGAIGGFGLMNHLMNSKTKSDLKAEEDAARAEYQQALLDQYNPRDLPVAARIPVSTLPQVQKAMKQAPSSLPDPTGSSSVPALKMAEAPGEMKSGPPSGPGSYEAAIGFQSPATQQWGASPRAGGYVSSLWAGLGKNLIPPVPRPEGLPYHSTAENFVPPTEADAVGLGASKGLHGPSPTAAKPGPVDGESAGDAKEYTLGTTGRVLEWLSRNRDAVLAGGGVAALGLGAYGLNQLLRSKPKPHAKSATKVASSEVLDELEVLAEAVEKKASVLGFEAPSWGQLQGMYGAYAIPAAAASGLLAYNHFRSRSTNTLLEKALKERERQRWASRPPEIYAVPQPVHLEGGHLTETESKKMPELAALKAASVKSAIYDGALLGGVIGGAAAPPGNAWRGVGRGAALGAATNLGAAVGAGGGALTGALGGDTLGRLIGGPDGARFGGLAGLGLGAVLGGVGGGVGTFRLLKQPIWNRPWKGEEKPQPKNVKDPEKSASLLGGTGLAGGLGAAASSIKPALGGLKAPALPAPQPVAAPLPAVPPGVMKTVPEPAPGQPGWQHQVDGLGSQMAGIGKDVFGGVTGFPSRYSSGHYPHGTPLPGVMKDKDKYAYRPGGVGYYKLPPPPGPIESKLSPDSYVPTPPAASPLGKGWQGNAARGK